MNPIFYSLIIPTYNRLEELIELCRSLKEQKPGKYKLELIIVDDGSTDGTKSYFEKEKFGFEVKYHYQENRGPGPARNLGMAVAQGNYLLFVDSDCTLPPDYFNQLTTYIEQHNPDAFGGPDTYHSSFSPLLKAINYSMTSFIGTGGTRGSATSVTRYYPRSFNMGIHKKVFEKIGGFGSLRHGQDMDFSARIYNAGYTVHFVPDAFVYHKRRTNLSKFYRQIHNWGVARINLGRLHKELLKPVHFLPALIVIATLSIFLLFFLFEWAYYLLILMIVGILLLAFFAFTQSLLQYRNVKVAFLSIITLYLQVYAYGIGFLKALFQIYILKRSEARGITKNYY